jgi:phage tail tape-measure protein
MALSWMWSGLGDVRVDGAGTAGVSGYQGCAQRPPHHGAGPIADLRRQLHALTAALVVLIAIMLGSFTHAVVHYYMYRACVIPRRSSRSRRGVLEPHSSAKADRHCQEDGPAAGSTQGGKLSTSPHSRPSTRNRHR